MVTAVIQAVVRHRGRLGDNMRTISFNKFDGGVTNDPRVPNENMARCVTNFDVLTNSYKMSPYHDSESGDSSASTSQKQNFCIALWLPGSTNANRLFSLGVKSGAGTAEVLMKSLGVGGGNDFSDATWMTPSNNQSTTGATSFNLFIYYKKTGFIYGARAGTAIWAFDPTSNGAWVDTSHSLSYTNIAQGVVHPKDEIMYIPYDNKIAANNNGSWNDTILTLPSTHYITSIAVDGNYLSIAMAPLTGTGDSFVYRWDRDSTLATLPEIINWGEGTIKILEEIQGALVGISFSGGSGTRFKDKVIFKYYNGVGGAIPFQVLEGTTGTQLPIAKQKIDQRIYFMMQITLNGAVREGVWSVGHKPNQQYSVVHERTPNNDTALSSGTLANFIIIGDFMFQAYQSSATWALSKTNDQTSYTATSIYETTINPDQPERIRGSAGLRSTQKQLVAVALSTVPLTSGQQIVCKYKVDGGSYATIFTQTTTGTVVTERTLDANGVQFKNGREYEFRFESTGGAEITEFKYKIEELLTLL